LDIKTGPELKRYMILLYAIIAGVLFDILFYNKTLGISYLIFVAITIVIIAAAFKQSDKKLNKRAWFFSVPVILLSSTYFIFSNQILRTLNFLVVPLLIIMMAILVAKVNKRDWSDIGFIGDMAKRIFVPFRFIHRPFISLSPGAAGNKEGGKNSGQAADSKEEGQAGGQASGSTEAGNAAVGNAAAQKTSNRALLKVVLGLLISVPVLALILWLLSSADMVFKNLFINMPVLTIFKHFVIIMLVFIYSACFIWALLKAISEKGTAVVPARRNWKQFIDPVVLITILVLVNAVYGIFSVIQFAYLFGGNSFILPSSLTYAEYARRGFAELVVVTLINFAIVGLGLTFVKKQSGKIFNFIRSLLTLLVVFTFVMLVSAFYRMVVYEQAYGFTYLRIFVQAFMIMLFFIFIINFIYIWHRNLAVIKAYFIVALSVYIILNFANVDRIIASNNIERYNRTGSIDEEYLGQLSYEAIPAINSFLKDIKESPDAREKKISDSIMEHFSQDKESLLKHKSWQSFNISKNRALEILESID
jgi:hypothetical protein